MFFDATVVSRRILSPGMIRLTLGGQGLSGYPSTGIPDEYLRLFFANEQTGRLHLPAIDEDGRWTYPDGGQSAIRCSTYTVRAVRPKRDEIDIDLVIHPGGRASEWAQRVAIGQTITVNRPRGICSPPDDAVWQVLLCDATGLPALARLLEQTPPHRHTRAFVEVAASEHKLDLPHHDHATVTWIPNSGNGVAHSRLAEILKAMPLPPAPGYIWAAGEQKAVRAIRRHVRHELGYPADRYDTVAYWIDGKTDWEARWNAMPSDIRTSIDAAWSSGREPEELQDEYDATLEKFGL